MHASDTKRLTRLILRWTPALAWMGLIFALSSLSSVGIPSGTSGPAHFLAYAVLGALCALAFDRRIPFGRRIAYAVLISSLYGITDEIHQSFVPGRMPDVVDWGLDTLGALAGAIAILRVRHAVSRRSSDGSSTA